MNLLIKKDLLKKNTVARKKAKLHKIAKEAGVKLEKGVAKAAKKVEPDFEIND